MFDESETLYRVLKPTEASFVPVGELAFFLGIPQPFTFTGESLSRLGV